MTCKIIKNGNNEASKLEENSFELQNENIQEDDDMYENQQLLDLCKYIEENDTFTDITDSVNRIVKKWHLK